MKLGFLASGGGTNLLAILDAIAAGKIPAAAKVVVCNNSAAGAMARARQHGVRTAHLSSFTHPDPHSLDQAITGVMEANGVELVVCAGYNKLVGPFLLQRFRNRVLNIHPSLLPRHGGQGMFGMEVHESVLASGDAQSGPTVHLVDAEYDRGPIVAQSRVAVLAGDTSQSLQKRVLAEEHKLYPDTLRRIALGEIDLEQLH